MKEILLMDLNMELVDSLILQGHIFMDNFKKGKLLVKVFIILNLKKKKIK